MNNLFSFFLGGSKGAEDRLTRALYREAKALQPRVPCGTERARQEFVCDFLFDLSTELDAIPSEELILLVHDTIVMFLFHDRFLIKLPDREEELLGAGLRDSSRVREVLKRHIYLVKEQHRLLPMWRHKLLCLFAGVLRSLPLSAFSDLTDEGTIQPTGVLFPEARVYDLCDDLRTALAKSIATICDDDMVDASLFMPIHEQLFLNIDVASGIPLEQRYSTKKARIGPHDYTGDDHGEMVETYLQRTPLSFLFESHLPFHIPFAARFEHTHVLGGTGHGKTQLLQFLIASDLAKAAEDGRSIIVLDSHGDLIRTISRLACFAPDGDLSDRLVIIDPTDVEYPPAFNMFDFGRQQLASSPRERELLLNASVEAYEYFFGELLGAELTQRQGVTFRFLARLLLEIPNATIHTLRDLMEQGEKYRKYMEMLPHSARGFFETRFFDRSFSETKKQILARLWGILGNAALERMFSHSENRIDLGELTQAGKIIIISPSKEFLGQDGANIFGRFMITMLVQATLQRAALPADQRNPTFVYIDEAEDYIDQNIGRLLTQARKYKVGLVLAHQNLEQLPPDLRSTVLANTTIKFVGGVSARDAAVLDGELRVSKDFLLSQRKQKRYSEFACFIRNETSQAISLRVPLGVLEASEKSSRRDYEQMIEENRERYTSPPEYPSYADTRRTSAAAVSPKTTAAPTPVEEPIREKETAVPGHATMRQSEEAKPKRVTPIVPPAPRLPQGGGKKHRYLQELVKKLAEEHGFRAQIEELTEDGRGRIDVVLTRGERKIACEISVTTNRDHELANVEKCLAAGYAEVIVLAHDARHQKSLATFVGGNLEESIRRKVSFLTPEMVNGYLGGRSTPTVSTEQVVRGYRVKVKSVSDQADSLASKSAITSVLASMIKETLSS